MINLEKIKAGDTLILTPCVVTSTHVGSVMAEHPLTGYSRVVYPQEIEKHIPAKRELKVGPARVENCFGKVLHVDILAIDGDRAWCKFADGSRFDANCRVLENI